MKEHNIDDEFVNIPVPKRFVMDVYQFLASQKQENASNKDDMISRDVLPEWWAANSQISLLKRAIKNKTVLTLLNLTASHPMEWINFEQVYVAAGRSSDQAKADLRGLTLLIKQLFPDNPGGWWPIKNEGGSPMQYQMSEEIAQLWNRG